MLTVVIISLLGESFILGHFELTPPRMLRIGFGLALLPGIVTTHPVVHSVQAAALVVLMAIGVSFVSLTIG